MTTNDGYESESNNNEDKSFMQQEMTSHWEDKISKETDSNNNFDPELIKQYKSIYGGDYTSGTIQKSKDKKSLAELIAEAKPQELKHRLAHLCLYRLGFENIASEHIASVLGLLDYSLKRLNSVTGQQKTFDDVEHIKLNEFLIMQGAVVAFFGKQALQERGREYFVEDGYGGVTYEFPNVSGLIQQQYEVELADYRDNLTNYARKHEKYGWASDPITESKLKDTAFDLKTAKGREAWRKAMAEKLKQSEEISEEEKLAADILIKGTEAADRILQDKKEKRIKDCESKEKPKGSKSIPMEAFQALLDIESQLKKDFVEYVKGGSEEVESDEDFDMSKVVFCDIVENKRKEIETNEVLEKFNWFSKKWSGGHKLTSESIEEAMKDIKELENMRKAKEEKDWKAMEQGPFRRAKS